MSLICQKYPKTINKIKNSTKLLRELIARYSDTGGEELKKEIDEKMNSFYNEFKETKELFEDFKENYSDKAVELIIKWGTNFFNLRISVDNKDNRLLISTGGTNGVAPSPFPKLIKEVTGSLLGVKGEIDYLETVKGITASLHVSQSFQSAKKLRYVSSLNIFSCQNINNIDKFRKAFPSLQTIDGDVILSRDNQKKLAKVLEKIKKGTRIIGALKGEKDQFGLEINGEVKMI